MQIVFTVAGKPETQGSIRSFNSARTGKIVSVSDNPRLGSYRYEVGMMAMLALAQTNYPKPMCDKHVAVELVLEFTLLRPQKCPKGRKWPSVKPDIDKLTRATLDALTGILYVDDGQVVRVLAEKVYGLVEQVHISMRSC